MKRVYIGIFQLEFRYFNESYFHNVYGNEIFTVIKKIQIII